MNSELQTSTCTHTHTHCTLTLIALHMYVSHSTHHALTHSHLYTSAIMIYVKIKTSSNSRIPDQPVRYTAQDVNNIDAINNEAYEEATP